MYKVLYYWKYSYVIVIDRLVWEKYKSFTFIFDQKHKHQNILQNIFVWVYNSQPNLPSKLTVFQTNGHAIKQIYAYSWNIM